MYKFKKQYDNESIAFKGHLISKKNLTDDIAEQILKIPSIAHRIEKIEALQEAKIVAEKRKKSRIKKS